MFIYILGDHILLLTYIYYYYYVSRSYCLKSNYIFLTKLEIIEERSFFFYIHSWNNMKTNDIQFQRDVRKDKFVNVCI